MTIQELIETVVAYTDPNIKTVEFTFELWDGQGSGETADAQNVLGLDDGVAFLFDKELFGWQVGEYRYEVCVEDDDFVARRFASWDVSLYREGQGE